MAVEDELGESISTQILRHFDIEIWYTIRGKGNVPLRQKAPELNRSANGAAIFLLTDLDSPGSVHPDLSARGLKDLSIQNFSFVWQLWRLKLG